MIESMHRPAVRCFSLSDVDKRYADDPSRLFMANGDGSFSERAYSAGITHTDRGLGVVCADYNGDGRIDILIANNGQSPTVYENMTDSDNHYLAIDLVGKAQIPMPLVPGSPSSRPPAASFRRCNSGPGTCPMVRRYSISVSDRTIR